MPRIPPPREWTRLQFYRRQWAKLRGGARSGEAARAYDERLEREQHIYRDRLNVHELPDIFHYWSNKHLQPLMLPFGFSNPDELFANALFEAGQAKDHPRFASIGAGNCDTEVRVASLLRNRGMASFTIECIDINESMLARGRALAEREGVAPHVAFTREDFNRWRPGRPYDAIIANQSLHHVVALEHLFDAVRDGLAPGAPFVVSDMIGRNGHQRWPEALEIVQEYWRELPAPYRRNQLLHRYEHEYMDWDCSREGFEGVRAQDILPLMVERFEFDLFLPFANLVDPFIDRAFGHNFDAQAPWDRDFIDRVHARDEEELRAGRIKPTHLMAVMCMGRKGRERFRDGLAPAACVRQP